MIFEMYIQIMVCLRIATAANATIIIIIKSFQWHISSTSFKLIVAYTDQLLGMFLYSA